MFRSCAYRDSWCCMYSRYLPCLWGWHIHKDNSIQAISGQAELITSTSWLVVIIMTRFKFFVGICICAEQTFTEASAKDWRFTKAFSIAMSAYMRSTSPREDVNREIRVLLDGSHGMDLRHCQPLKDIIKNHRLRTHFVPDLAACLIMIYCL